METDNTNNSNNPINYSDRAKSNEFNCKHGAMQLLYSLAELGLLKEPFRSWSQGFDIDVDSKESKMYEDAILDISESIVMFYDEIKNDRHILGDTNSTIK